MRKHFVRIAANLEGKFRREKLEGQTHLVVDGAILGEAVLEGSDGAFLYPEEENSKDPDIWDHMPLVIYHPKLGKNFVSARKPGMLNKRKVGIALNTYHDDKLRTEFWFNEKRTKQIDRRVYNKIVKGKSIELSTGLTFDVDKSPGRHEGKRYVGIARNYRPDHIAILPDQQGAYSREMGGGLRANLRRRVTNVIGNDPIESAKDLKAAIKAANKDDNPALARKYLIKKAKSLRLVSLIPDDWAMNMTANNKSTFNEVTDNLRKELRAKFGKKGLVERVYPSHCIYWTGGKLYKVNYKRDDDESVTLTGSPVVVVRTTDYQPDNKSGTREKDSMAKFDKQAHIDSLIGHGWEESDRKKLEKLDEDVLQILKPVAKTEMMKTNKKRKDDDDDDTDDDTDDERISRKDRRRSGLTTNERRQLKRLQVNEERRKKKLVKKLIANEAVPFTEEFLMTKDVEELEGWNAAINMAEEGEDNGIFRRDIYAGDPLTGNRGRGGDDDDLEEPPLVKDIFDDKDVD